MISKSDVRILSLMLEKASRLSEILKKYGRKEIQNNYILSDSINYEFEKLFEDSSRLSLEFRIERGKELNFEKLRAIRNRIAHDYESVILDVLLDTVENDIPNFISEIEKVLSDKWNNPIKKVANQIATFI